MHQSQIVLSLATFLTLADFASPSPDLGERTIVAMAKPKVSSLFYRMHRILMHHICSFRATVFVSQRLAAAPQP